jgi:hypothetical protein
MEKEIGGIRAAAAALKTREAQTLPAHIPMAFLRISGHRGAAVRPRRADGSGGKSAAQRPLFDAF